MRVLIAIAAWLLAAQACATTIEVFYNAAALQAANADYEREYRGVAVVHYNLDKASQLKQQMNRNMALPGDAEQAKTQARQWLNSSDGKALLAELMAAEQGKALLMTQGITKLPAVLIDRQYVFYGVRNVATAINALQQAKRAQP